MRGALALLLALVAGEAAAASVAPGGLRAAIAGAEPGDTLTLAPGRHSGPVRIDRPVTLLCEDGARIGNDGADSVITVEAPGVVIRGCAISGSGRDGKEMDSGVRLLKSATGALVEDCDLSDNLHGVDIHGAKDAIVRGNRITGRDDHRMNDRGNGVYVWNAPGAVVEDNDISLGRDGIFVNTSRDNIFRDNRFRDLRFAVHYMYAHGGLVTGNDSRGNHLGYAIMYSDRVRVEGNISIGDRDHGVMLNYANKGTVIGNLVRGVRDRALFIYNAHKNTIADNVFEASGIGVHFTAGSERNAMQGNGFIGNRTQVKYVGSKWVDWSAEGRGNYWSDHGGYDLNGDGLADAPYRPNDSMDRVLWRQPAARLLLGAPAVQLVRWAQGAFPATLPGGVIDRFPLMAPPTPGGGS